MNSYSELRKIDIINRINGWWFTQFRNKNTIFIETVGRGMALTLRALSRKKVGSETFNIWVTVAGFLWIRLCTSMGVTAATGEGMLDNIFNLTAFTGVQASILNVLSWLFVMASIWHATRSGLRPNSKKSETPNVLDRGKYPLLDKLVKEDKSFFSSKLFLYAILIPSILIGIGAGMMYFGIYRIVALYLLGSSLALLIDELNHQIAVIRYFRLELANYAQSEQRSEKHKGAMRWFKGF